jgi:Xaa-Pro aminopeptidase
MHAEQRQRTRELLDARGITNALFAHPHSVTWLTGFAPPVQLGRHLFGGGPPLVHYADGRFTLVVVDAWRDLAAPFAQDPDGAVVTYQGYTIEHDIESLTNLRHLLAELFSGASLQAGRMGVETMEVPVAAARLLAGGWGLSHELTAIDGWLLPLRAIKTGEERSKLCANFSLGDIGHAAARSAAVAGASEIEVWTAVESAIQNFAGTRIPIGNDCVSGRRQDNVGGWPGELQLAAGDSLIVDISVVHLGYWSDSCATYVAGRPTPRQSAIHRTVAEALALGASMLRPGVVCKDIDRAMRRHIEAQGYPVYPHHGGHGVGVSGHENPRIVPYSEERIAAGMVIMLEPGIYFPGETAFRLEDGYFITEDGAISVTAHDKRLVAY